MGDFWGGNVEKWCRSGGQSRVASLVAS